MASTAVNTDLPPTSSPRMDRFRDVPMDLLPFACYIHVRLSSAELNEVLTTFDSEVPEGARNAVKTPPRYDFAGVPLRASFDHHIDEVVPSGEFDHFHFVAVVDENWREKGILIVALDDDWGELKVDKICIPAAQAGLIVVNLQIGNVGFEEYKEQYESCNNDSAGDGDNRLLSALDESIQANNRPEDYYSDGAADLVPYCEHWIGLYAVEEIPFDELMRRLSPRPVPLEQCVVRPEGRVPDQESAAIRVASSLHPVRCRDNRLLYRKMFLIADRADYTRYGIMLVKLEWDGKVDGRSTDELSSQGITAEKDTQRLPVMSYITATAFNNIASNWSPWKFSVWTFLLYGGRRISVYRLLDVLDKKSEKRKPGAERFLCGISEERERAPEGGTDWEWEHPWQGVIRRHPTQVYRYRFVHMLARQYFVYCPKRLESDSDLVTLVKVDWDGAVEDGSIQQLWDEVDLSDKVTTVECPASDAYDSLVQYVEGNKAWPGTQPDPDKFV